MDLGLKGRSALVTGAGAGLGFGAARALIEEGANVALAARGEAALGKAVEMLAALGGGRAVGLTADVSVPGEPERVARDAEAAVGPLAILVANAGGPRAGTFFELSESDWQAAYQLTLMSAVRLCRAVLPGMLERRWGRIVFITSTSVKQPIDGLLLSNVFRPGVVGLAKTLAGEVARHGVTVNCVCPGPYETARIEELMESRARRAGTDVAEARRRYIEGVPVGRFGQPIELGRAIAFLASEEAAFVTGTSLSVDGGSVRGIFG